MSQKPPKRHADGVLSAEDRALWERVTASVNPLKETCAEPDDRNGVPPGRRDAGMAAAESTPPRSDRTVPLQVPRTSQPIERAGLPSGGLDRRTERRLMRGLARVEARLDLHGSTREAAREDLLGFLVRSRQRGLRLVLVITGKGRTEFARHTLHGATHFETPERRSVLRNELPRWLGEAEFREHVIGFQPAHPRHGGGGAFYVRLRRHRKARDVRE